MYPSPYPEYYIIRNPGGRIVPVVAVDQLPDWIQLGGVPREMSAEQAVGMTNLGSSSGSSGSVSSSTMCVGDDDLDDDDGSAVPSCGYYEVQLRTDLIRAILSEKGQEENGPGGDYGSGGGQEEERSSSSPSTAAVSEIATMDGGCDDDTKEEGGEGKEKGRGQGTIVPARTRPDSSRSSNERASSKVDMGAMRKNRATTNMPILDCDSSSDSGLVLPASLVPEQKAAAGIHVHQHQYNQYQEEPQGAKHHLREGLELRQTSTAEPILSASRHDATVVLPDHGLLHSSSSSSSSGNSQQTAYHNQQQQNVTRRITRGCNKPPIFFGVHGGDPNTVFCRHWCHHGSCKWGWNCKYQHRMPADAEGLREVGLRDFPTWYLLYMDLNRDQRPEHYEQQHPAGGLAVEGPWGDNINIGTTTTTITTNNNNDSTAAVTRQQQQRERYHDHQQHHHPSAIDLRLMHGRMSALLSGSTAMSKRQKLRQLKEMRGLFQQQSASSSSPSNNKHHHGHHLTDVQVVPYQHPRPAAGAGGYACTQQPSRQQQQHHHHHQHQQPQKQQKKQYKKMLVGGGIPLPDAGSEGLAQQLLRDKEEDEEEGDEVGRLTPVSSDDDLESSKSSNNDNIKLIDV